MVCVQFGFVSCAGFFSVWRITFHQHLCSSFNTLWDLFRIFVTVIVNYCLTKMSKPITALIVGANRGLGLQMVKDALSELNASKVFATYRSEDQSKVMQTFRFLNAT